MVGNKDIGGVNLIPLSGFRCGRGDVVIRRVASLERSAHLSAGLLRLIPNAAYAASEVPKLPPGLRFRVRLRPTARRANFAERHRAEVGHSRRDRIGTDDDGSTRTIAGVPG